MRSLLLLASVAAVAAAVTSEPASAQGPKKGKKGEAAAGPLDPVGRFEKFDQGQGARYAVWYEDGTWQIRTTAPVGNGSRFVGKVRLKGGAVTNIKGIGLEPAKRADRADWVIPASNRSGFAFDLKTVGKVDGVSFKVLDSTTDVTFTLQIDGDDAPKRIFVGPNGGHPDKATFTLPANPAN